jgi:hypothetical protein
MKPIKTEIQEENAGLLSSGFDRWCKLRGFPYEGMMKEIAKEAYYAGWGGGFLDGKRVQMAVDKTPKAA